MMAQMCADGGGRGSSRGAAGPQEMCASIVAAVAMTAAH